MNILVLHGSPRRTGNTAHFVAAFGQGARSAGHRVDVKVLSTMKIAPCIACDSCRPNGTKCGHCIQNDDACSIIEALPQYDMIVFASPVYYWGFSGQMQALITRFYPYGPIPVKKFAMILSSGSPDVYDALNAQYANMVRYFGGESLGTFTFNGPNQTTEENLLKIKAFGASL